MPRPGNNRSAESVLGESLLPVSNSSAADEASCTCVRDEHQCRCSMDRQRYSYGVGHMFNDLSASCWFSYLLVYLHSVAQLTNLTAGYIYLLGHVVDAVCTPTVGMLSDRSSSKYGRRKVWHAVGSVAAFVSFPFVLSDPCTTFGVGGHSGTEPAATAGSSAGFLNSDEPTAPSSGSDGCNSWEQWQYMLWYGVSVSVFQFGWASVQTTHLALGRELSPSTAAQDQKPTSETDDTAPAAKPTDGSVRLYSTRYGFGIISTLVVYAAAWILLDSASAKEVGRSDAPQFFYLALIAAVIGAIATCIFHAGTIERPASSLLERAAAGQEQTPLGFWLTQPTVWAQSLVYSSSRIVVNLSQTYLPLYLLNTLELPKVSIAFVPLMIYGSGLLASQVNGLLNSKLGRLPTYLLGLSAASAALGLFFAATPATKHLVFTGAAILGAGCSILLPTAQSMVSDMVPEERKDATATGTLLLPACLQMIPEMRAPCSRAAA
eukprot:COSAG05_NODE_63_length_22889_cov_41.986617_13_plen_491_part_00